MILPAEVRKSLRCSPGYNGGVSDGSDLGVILSGGGARAAYQVGVLTALARKRPELNFPVITGVSAGAINAAYLASSRRQMLPTLLSLSTLWSNLEAGRIFDVRPTSLSRIALRWTHRLLGGTGGQLAHARGFVDTEPLRRFLRRSLPHHDGILEGIEANLDEGRLRAAALTALNYGTGQTVTWVEGRGVALWERPNRRSEACRLSIDHVMASAALPLFFPAIRVGNGWFGDGGIRLAAPFSPALHLGARRILAVSTRYIRTFEEAERPETTSYPPPGQILSQLMKAVFLDVLDQDVLRLEKINELLVHLDESERMGMNRIDFVVVRPSVDLGKLAAGYEPKLPKTFRYLARGLGSRETESPDFLSMLMFEPDYLRRLIEIGEADAESRMDELLALVDGRAVTTHEAEVLEAERPVAHNRAGEGA
jgi:NTE family protein